MRHGSLFSGIGGFDYAAQLMGWENVFHCEWNEFGQKVLKHYWPQAISYHDITKTDFSIHRGEIDILTGGFPCQPYSAAGKRLGKEDDRHLWPEMLRAIREIQPTWVVGENVLGLVNWNGGLVFHEVQADLEAEGYEVQPYVLPAVSVNAPHRRDRVWFVAHSLRSRHGGKSEKTRPNHDEKREVYPNIGQHGDGIWGETERCGETSSNAPSDRREWIGQGDEAQNGQQKSGITRIMERRPEGFCVHGNATDTESARGGILRDKSSEERPQDSNELFGSQCGISGDEWDATDTSSIQLQRSQLNGSIGKQGQTKGQSRQSSRPVCSTWAEFPTQSPIRFRNDGISSRLDTDSISEAKWRNESIKAAGNAIVPQVVLQIFKAIEAYENKFETTTH